MRKKPQSLLKVYIIFILILLVLFGATLAVLWKVLAGYQQRCDDAAAAKAAKEAEKARIRAEYEAPQRAFEAFLADAGADWWEEEWFREHADSLDRHEDLEALFAGLLGAEDFAAYKAPDFTQEAPVYILKSGGEALARLYLTGENADWTVGQTEIVLIPDQTASLETAAPVPVLLNGAPLSAEFIVSERSYYDEEFYADRLVSPVTWVTYRADGLLCRAQIEEDLTGLETVFSEADGATVLLRTDGIAEDARSQSEKFIDTVLRYYMSGERDTYSNLRNCLGYVAAGSEAYNTLKASYDGITWNSTYTNQKTDIHADEAIIWAENCFSIDVHYAAEADYGGKTVNYASGVYRLYFYDFGSGWGIYSLRFQ